MLSDDIDLRMYGYDAQGLSVLSEDNNVIVEPVELAEKDVISAFVLERLDPLRLSVQMGIDVYNEALELVLLKLEQQN